MDLIVTGSTLAEQSLIASALTAFAYTHLQQALNHWRVTRQLAAVRLPLEPAGHDVIGLPDPGAARTLPAPVWDGQNCSILLADIVGFGAPYRTDLDRLALRRIMYQLLRSACEDSGIPWAACHREDRGDGALIVIPPVTLTRLAVHPLLSYLHAGLRRHNCGASEAMRLRLRLSLHVGPVTSDAEGVSGAAIIHAARMLEAPAFKRQLAQSAAHLGFVTSCFVYDGVVRHDPVNIDPDDYVRLTLRAKESCLSAWVRLL